MFSYRDEGLRYRDEGLQYRDARLQYRDAGSRYRTERLRYRTEGYITYVCIVKQYNRSLTMAIMFSEVP